MADTPRFVKYDGDQKLLAFAGAVSMVVGSLFWALAGLGVLLSDPTPGGATPGTRAAAFCFAATVTGCVLALYAWGLRVKMQRGDVVTRQQVALLMGAGLLVGVVLGFLIYLALRFKLEDPDFYHLASQPENLPPAVR